MWGKPLGNPKMANGKIQYYTTAFRRGCGSLERWQCSHWNARALPFKKALGSRWKNNTNGLFIFLHILCQDGKLRAFQDLRGQLLDFQKTKNVGQGILKKLYWKLMTQCKNPVVAVAYVMPISALHNLCSTHRGSQVQNLVCLLCVQRPAAGAAFRCLFGRHGLAMRIMSDLKV